ncbi:hypothetical protein BKA63DRAFT_401351 [Paraphoma chrysanthemicola]|nr:hypothetical protein BKA63DRAFT_401351 [Paraphoma chrysanthemicola]
MSYKVEELLALRDSVSESAVSIDKFADEDVIKAEKLLKEHGSPPGLRVTAGGRIVPSDLPPLGTSRFPDNTFKPTLLRVGPENVMPTQPQPSNGATARIEIVGGQPVIFVGDRMFALPAVNGSSTAGSAPFDSTSTKADLPKLNTQASMPTLPYGPPRTNSTSPFTGLDLATLRAQQTLKKQELRTVEQTEVLQASHQTEAWRAGMIEKKRCLIVQLDALRKSIAALEYENSGGSHTSTFPGPIGSVPGTTVPPSFVPQVQQPVPQSLFAYPAANPYTPLMVYPPPFGAYPALPAAEPTSFTATPAGLPHSPGSASRRSHAIEIKPPQQGARKPALNPKSPTYEPAAKPAPSQGNVPPTPSPPKRSPWRNEDAPLSDMLQHRQTSNDNPVVPSTPEKHWPASPWNEAASGHSNGNETISKLTSWPEAFGKQPSSTTLRQAAGRISSDILEQAPVIGKYATIPSSAHNVLPQSDSNQRTSTDENWPFSRKAVLHVPSTYQEGYQAGYDHIGMPDSPDVLQGYIQGLLHFLSDESKKGRLDAPLRDNYLRSIDSRTPSLRGLVANSIPHDSAVSMTFNQNNVPNGDYDTVRSSKESLMASLRRESADSLRGSTRDVPGSHARFDEASYASRQRNVSGLQCTTSPALFPDRLASGRQMASENEPVKPTHDKGSASLSSGTYQRQFSGVQLQNRGYGTPLSMQRFYPTPTEMSPKGFGSDTVPTVRPFPNHRLSGLDGAMDDLADLVMDTHVNESGSAAGNRSNEAPRPVGGETEEVGASCFGSSAGKGKQKASLSPTKTSSNARDDGVTSPNASSSPKKSGEHSPAKAKLEHVTNKFRRTKKDDPRTMSPEEKVERSKKWRDRFQAIKRSELEEIEKHRRNNRT